MRAVIKGGIIAAAVLLLLTIATLFIKIDEIEVTGDVTMFNESEVIRAAEINIGDRLFHKSSGKIKRNITENMPIAHNVKVTKTPLGKVTIHVELLKVDYFAEIDGLYCAIDSDLTVLDISTSSARYSNYGAVRVILPKVREPVLGEPLIFYDTVEETNTENETLYEVREESFYAYLTTFLSELAESGYREDANAVILTEKFDITLIYGGKYSIRFGDISHLDVKFKVLYEILREGSMQYSDKVAIDLSDPSRASARTDMTLDFSEFVD